MDLLWVFSTKNVDVSVELEEFLIIVSNSIGDDVYFKGTSVLNSLVEEIVVGLLHESVSFDQVEKKERSIWLDAECSQYVL